MSEDGSWWRRLGSAFQPRSEVTGAAQAMANVNSVGRAQNAGVGFAALSVRSTASHRHRRSALENVRATSSSSHITTSSSELAPPASILPPRSPSTPPAYQRKQHHNHQQQPKSCPSSPPRSTPQPQPRSTSQPTSTPRQGAPQSDTAAADLRPGRSPQPPEATVQNAMPQPKQPFPQPPPQLSQQQQTPPSQMTIPVMHRHPSTIAEEGAPDSPAGDHDSNKTPASSPLPVRSLSAQNLQPGHLLSSPGTPATSGHSRASPGSPFSTMTRSKRSASLPRPVSVILSSPRASRDDYYHQRTHGGHIIMHPSHRRRASSTGSLAEAANLVATSRQYSATLASLLSMGYSKQRAEEALWKHPNKAAAYLEHQDHAGQDILVSDCEWCIPWLGLAHMIEVGSPPKPKPKPQFKSEPAAPRKIEKPILVENPRDSGGGTTSLPRAKQDTPSPSKTDDSAKTRVDHSTPTKKNRKSMQSQTSTSQASVYSQETTTDSIVPVIGHANGENCQICKTAVGGVCQWSDWGWEHGKWEYEFFNEDD